MTNQALADIGRHLEAEASRAEDPVDLVADMIANGATLASAASYWTADVATTGPALTLQLFADGTGRIAYDLDAFQPPAALTTRTLYDFTWTEVLETITMSFSGETATFSNITGTFSSGFSTTFTLLAANLNSA